MIGTVPYSTRCRCTRPRHSSYTAIHIMPVSKCRGGRAVADRGDLLAPPSAHPARARPRHRRGRRRCSPAAGPGAGVQVDPAQALAAPGMVAQHLAHGDLAPGRVVAAVEQAFGWSCWPAVMAVRHTPMPRLPMKRMMAAWFSASGGQVAGTSRWAIRRAGAEGSGRLEVVEVAVQVDCPWWCVATTRSRTDSVHGCVARPRLLHAPRRGRPGRAAGHPYA